MRALTLLLATFLGLVACENTTEPMPEMENRSENIAILTLTVSEASVPSGFNKMAVMLGGSELDTAKWNLGQTVLNYGDIGVYNHAGKVILVGKSRADIYLNPMSSVLIGPKAVNGYSVSTTYEWGAIEQEKHPGVAYSDSTEFLFRTATYKVMADGSMEPILYPPGKIASQTLWGTKVKTEFNLPSEKSFRFTTVLARKSIGCSGNDSLTLESKSGMSQLVNTGLDQASGKFVIFAIKAQCTMYPSLEAANLALK